MKITRKVVATDATMRTEDNVLTIDIKPGWKSGTKIAFPKEGDQHPNSVPAGIAFIIKDKPHSTFKRDGSDIPYVDQLPLRKALCGISSAPLDGTTIPLDIDNVIKPGAGKRMRH